VLQSRLTRAQAAPRVGCHLSVDETPCTLPTSWMDRLESVVLGMPDVETLVGARAFLELFAAATSWPGVLRPVPDDMVLVD
jgi:hypothetical protein